MVNRNTLLIEGNRFLVDMRASQQSYIGFLDTMAKYHKYSLMQQMNQDCDEVVLSAAERNRRRCAGTILAQPAEPQGTLRTGREIRAKGNCCGHGDKIEFFIADGIAL